MPKSKPSFSRRRKRSSKFKIIRNLCNKSYPKNELPELEMEVDENPPLTMFDVIKGRRIIDVSYVLTQYEHIANHKYICTMGKTNIQKETNQGLLHSLHFKCDEWENRLAEEMKLAGDAEKRLAIETNHWIDINHDRFPYITVIVDGGIQRLVKGVRTTIKNGKNNNEEAFQLRQKLLNAPFHVFGNHDNCCKHDRNETNILELAISTGVFSEVQKYMETIIQKADGLMFNEKPIKQKGE
ncbi:hypothetical protein RN001_006094 [Aquatica leii]|uniref:Uncharacterized protein n=1 Tax=Aquatica leii TaxID=1421715 RepID=A0AAN7P7E4_9COLE|nr:hypothetical protein RN001_006094 [Aquatica leii]